jgi:type II secretory pathway predicted ATPase ExeA
VTTAVLRPIPFDSHPLVQQKYIIPTPSIDAAYDDVKTCIRHRTPGALLLGPSRFGKTYAGRYMDSTLKEDFPSLASIGFTAEKKKQPVESAFFENLLVAVGHKEPHSGSNSVKRQRLIAKLVELVVRSGRNVLVVFADEAQRFEALDYEWLWDLHDALEKHSVRMITFLIGNQKLKQQKNAFREAGETPIISRFMVDEIPFHGVRCADDVATCLTGYDEATYPENSDWTYTRFFFPMAWQEKLRLGDQATALWEAFDQAHKRAGFSFPIEIPMTYFARAVEIACMDYSDKDSATFRFSPAIWENVVRDSKYVVAMVELHLNPGIDD